MDQTAAVESRAKQIEKEYLSSLADLNVNSKPLINMLTILAEENLEYAQIIVHAVEKHLAKVKQFMSILTHSTTYS
uniref:CID domain-containing protein n=1 Tax=Anopheles christyi TaxID=43041 RepID=A0A182JNF3_9DIPT